jgi:Holliday junction resolvasome RuvABC endonuclease subunit
MKEFGIVAVDLSLTSTGFARTEFPAKGNFDFRTFKTTPADGKTVDRALIIAKQIMKHSNKDRDFFFVEDYAYAVGRNKNTISKLAFLGELNGVVKLVLQQWSSKPVIPIPIGTWKKFLSGNGNLPKDEFKLAVFKKFNVDCKTNDEAAAIAIMDFSLHLLGGDRGSGSLKKYEQDVIKSYIKRKKEAKNR